MKINVVEPQAWMLTDIESAKRQLALCAYAAGLSRGRAQDVYKCSFKDYSRFDGATFEYKFQRDYKQFKDAESLLRKLLNYKPHPHESVIEHSSISFLFQCSRIATHEIVRHRLCAFTQTSTRYIEEKDEVTLIKPPHMLESDLDKWGFQITDNQISHIDDPTRKIPSWIFTVLHSLVEYANLRDEGVKRESARYLLPHCLSCWIQITANFRQWRHMIRLRTSKKAAPEMQRLFGQVKDKLTEISPILTEDL
jgi:thymidylate synthase (FAD)